MSTIYRSGVYCILNLLDCKRYVGSSYCYRSRLKSHKNDLKKGRHRNNHLQAAWNKYGAKWFVFFVLEKCSVENCIAREQHWLDKYKSFDRKFGYNSSPTAGTTLGLRWSTEARARWSAAMSNPPAEWKKNRVKAMGRPETRAKMSASHKGFRHSEESKAKMSKAARVRFANMTQGQIAKAISHLWSPKTRAKISKARKGFRLSPQSIAKMRATLTGRKLSEEHKANIGAGVRRYRRRIKR